MDEKKTKPIRTIEKCESLSQGLFVVPLLSEAVFLLPVGLFSTILKIQTIKKEVQ
jgi:hypothetical protein